MKARHGRHLSHHCRSPHHFFQADAVVSRLALLVAVLPCKVLHRRTPPYHAQALEVAGCFAIVLECVPAPVAAAVTSALHIPTIGIGAGPSCSGQVLVFHDLLGMLSHPHHAQARLLRCLRFLLLTCQQIASCAEDDLAHSIRPTGQMPSRHMKPTSRHARAAVKHLNKQVDTGARR